MFISHDRYFINRIATKVVEVAGGALTPYLGDYDDYLAAKARVTADGAEGRSPKAVNVFVRIPNPPPSG